MENPLFISRICKNNFHKYEESLQNEINIISPEISRSSSSEIQMGKSKFQSEKKLSHKTENEFEYSRGRNLKGPNIFPKYSENFLMEMSLRSKSPFPDCKMFKDVFHQNAKKSTKSEYSNNDLLNFDSRSWGKVGFNEGEFNSRVFELNKSLKSNSFTNNVQEFGEFKSFENCFDIKKSFPKPKRVRSCEKTCLNIQQDETQKISVRKVSQSSNSNLIKIGDFDLKSTKTDSTGYFENKTKSSNSKNKLVPFLSEEYFDKVKINFDIKEPLKKYLQEFELKIEKEKDIDSSSKEFLVLLLKFLFGINIQKNEFENLNPKNKKLFKNFLVERYFRKDIESKLCKKRSFNEFSKEKSNKEIFLEPETSFEEINLLPKDLKKGVLDFIDLNIFDKKKYFGKRTSKGILFMLRCVTLQDIKNENFNFLKLQDYLRKREILSVINKRIKNNEKNAKRNDEKIKKIFKKTMKALIHKFKTKILKKKAKLNSIEIEKEFYKFYFSDVEGNVDISHFYDPLKKRLNNPKFKSICNQYLKNFWLSEKFVQDFLEHCNGPLILEGMKTYSDKLLKKFKENTEFLKDIDKAKSKFEWGFFEYEVAILHFVFSFYNLKTE